MNERPILFSGSMVRAILAGSKTQTRRVIKPQPHSVDEGSYTITRWNELAWFPGGSMPDVASRCPYGVPGDRLWVRETLRRDRSTWVYGVDHEAVTLPANHPSLGAMYGWAHHNDGDVCVSIHMPRWASRITLEVTKVRVERVQDISIDDVIAEGIERVTDGPHANDYWREETGKKYAELWDSINAKRGFGWDKNPWVWVVEFKKLEAR